MIIIKTSFYSLNNITFLFYFLQFRYSGEGNIPEIVNELSVRAKNLDPLEIAIEVFDSATTMANNGNIDDAVPLYLHVSQFIIGQISFYC